jgi:hypothetical protein
MRLHFVALLTALSWARGWAGDATPAPPAAASPNDVICTTDHVVGSHIPHKTCATRRAREERAKADQEALDSLRARTNMGTGPNGTHK